MKTTVIAIGGNSLWRKGQFGTEEEQRLNARNTALSLLPLIDDRRLVITHGNGPQVGAILLQNESCTEVPAMSLDVCGAMSQGQIGYFLQQEMVNVLNEAGKDISVVSIITQVLVDGKDPAFSNPSKPIGPFMNHEEANWASEEKGWSVKEIKGGGWRRIVPSPEPIGIVEKRILEQVLSTDEGIMMIAAGGGGIPVVMTPKGLQGIEAVIDKDLASLVLAKQIRANEFILLTDTDKVYLDYGRPEQKALDHVTAKEAENYLEQGQFPPGSMGPKVRAVIDFVRSGGERAIITNSKQLSDALKGKSGTICTLD